MHRSPLLAMGTAAHEKALVGSFEYNADLITELVIKLMFLNIAF